LLLPKNTECLFVTVSPVPENDDERGQVRGELNEKQTKGMR
jgi:hypothetical protein